MYNQKQMERIHFINPDRIAWCCADFGVSTDQLAAETGVPQANIARVLAREEGGGLTFKQLGKLAHYFGRGVLFFMDQTPVEAEQVHTPAFRTLANQKPELSSKLKLFIERVEQQRAVYVALRDELEDVELPRFIHPELPVGNSKVAARIARQWLGLDDHNTFDTYRAAIEAKGILVFKSNGYNGKWQIASESPILGFTLYDEACPVIVVKKQRTETQMCFTLMHEMGHLLLHRSSSIDDDQDMHSHEGDEREANAFAGHLLVPDAFLKQVDDIQRPIDASAYDTWLAHPRRHWGVSGEVILRRLLDSGRLSQQQYASYRQWKANLAIPEGEGGSRKYRYREPNHIFGETFVRTILGALSGRRITLTKASSYLDGLKLNDLHELERYYAGL